MKYNELDGAAGERGTMYAGGRRERERGSECAKRKKGNPLDIVGVEDERVMVLHALT